MTSGEAGPSPSALQRLSQQEFPHSPVLGGGRGRWRKMQVLPPRRRRPSGERGRQAREETSCHWSGHIRGRPSGDTWAWSLDGEEAFCTRGGLPGGAVAGAKALRLEEPSSRGLASKSHYASALCPRNCSLSTSTPSVTSFLSITCSLLNLGCEAPFWTLK